MASANKKIVIGAIAASALAAASAVQVAPTKLNNVPVTAYVGVEYVPEGDDVDLPGGGSVQPDIESCAGVCVLNSECNALSYYEDATSLFGTDKNCWIKKLADPCAGVPAAGYLMEEVTFAIRTDTCAPDAPVEAPTTDLAPKEEPAAPAPVEAVAPAPEVVTAVPPAPEAVVPPAPEAVAPAPEVVPVAPEAVAPSPVVSVEPPVAVPAAEPAAVPSTDRTFVVEPTAAPPVVETAPGPSTAPPPTTTTDRSIDLEAESGAMTLRSAAIAAVVAGVVAALA